MKKIAERYINVPNEVVYPYVNWERYSKIKADLNSKNIVSIGNASYYRGTDILIDSFLKLNRSYNNKLYIVGRKQIKLKELEDNPDKIKVTGRTDPIPYLSKCGLYINASRHDSFGINILEAMAAGIPPIITTHCGASEVLSKISKNLIVAPAASEIIKAVLWLNKDMKRKKVLSKKCIKLSKKFSKETSMKNFKEKFYKLLLKVK